MNYKKAVVLGLLDWVIVFAVVSAFLAWYNQFAWMKFIIAFVGGGVAYALAAYAELSSEKTALAYGATWVLVGIVLDTLITTQFNPAIFKIWSLWLGYLLTLFAPIVRARLAKN